MIKKKNVFYLEKVSKYFFDDALVGGFSQRGDLHEVDDKKKIKNKKTSLTSKR